MNARGGIELGSSPKVSSSKIGAPPPRKPQIKGTAPGEGVSACGVCFLHVHT